MTSAPPTPNTAPANAGITTTSVDWIANLILTAKTLMAAAECLPFPYVIGALGPVVPILEAVQKMTKNREDFEELCESIIEIVTMLQEKISQHGVNVTSSLQQFCEELQHLLREIQQKLGEIHAKQTKGLRRRLTEFSKSTSIGDELSRYKNRLERLRINFMLNINASASAPPPPLTTGCPLPSRIFRGRRDILQNMHDYFSQHVGKRHICLLHGLGGAGKTQICLKFLDETDNSRFTNVFFLDASTVDTIKSGLKNIALTQSIGSEPEDASHWLSSHQDEWLLIFDNADDPTINLFNYFPSSSSGNILITSRNPQLHVHAPDAHHYISDMEEQDAVELLLASAAQLRTTETEILATEIVKVLYCFPLAVVQAGAFIAQTGKFRKYLTLYEQNRAQLLSRLPSQSHDKYAWSVYTTWDISFKCLGPLAAQFLQICSFLHHERISEVIFSNAAAYKQDPLGPTEEQIKEPREFLDNFVTEAGTWDDFHFTDIITEIQGYSLITQDPDSSLLSIHPLVHGWSQRTINDIKSTQQCSAAILAMSTMSSLNDQMSMIKLLPHINSVVHSQPKLAHKFPYPFQLVYYYSGHFHKAEELSVALLEQRKHIFGDDHPETLRVMVHLAATYGELGKFTDAEELEVFVLGTRKHILGEEHPDTLKAMGNLAATYWSLGKLTDAEQLQVTVLKKRMQILGTEHPNTLQAMSNLAATYRILGRFTDAEDLEVTVLNNRMQMLGTEHLDTLEAISNLAATYRKLGKFTDAEELDVTVLKKRMQILGAEHPNTLKAMSNLAATYRQLRKFTDAVELLVIVVQNSKRILGMEHPHTLRAMSNLGYTYWCLERFKDAEELEISVLEKRKQILGAEHPDTLHAMTNLAFTYKSLEKFRQAEELQLMVLERKTLTLGPADPDTIAAQEALTQIRQDIENHNSSIQ
ncbi:hypothetical protein C8J57DRAFT_621737 [Mycena rebaudengoi]|nr:hypothetical protein C8J57DRAFT_621737 [Mycena rebaudengoi]